MGVNSNSDLIASLAERLPADKVEPYTAFAIRTRSLLAPEVLRAAGHEAAAARLVALSGAPDAHQRGLELLDRVVTREGIGAQSAEVATLYAQLLVRTDRTGELAALLDDPQTPLKKLDRWSLRTDLLNPHRAGAPDTSAEDVPGAEDSWLSVLNEIHEADGLEPVCLRPLDTGENPYQRLAAPSSEQVDGELVTVVMSAFRPDRDLLLAVRGVLEQTWRNLELLIVDDASPAGAEDLLEEAAALDPRVHVVRAPRNGGTYQARNLALTVAKGRWMTFQDSDDWTHPRRVELQVRHLLENPSLLANRTWTLRAYEDLTLTYVGYSTARLNASSLLFDRVPVQQLLGQFDAVRKSGDMELPFRLKALREGSVRDLRHPAPLAITQLRSNSLSRADAVPGWLRWDRLAYRDSYMEWHDQVRASRLDARLPGHESAKRPFPLPRAAWAPDRPAQPQPAHWQVVVLGDLRTGQPHAPRTIGVARAASDAGLTTAVANTESPTPIARRREPASRALSHDTRIGRLGLTNAHEDDRADLLIVTDPASLLHLDTASLDVHEILVLVDESEPVGWSVAAVHDRCVDLFGRQPRWGGPSRVHDLPDGPSPARAAIPADRWVVADLAPVTGADWPRVPSTRRDRPAEEPVIIGHHLRDYVARWPKGPKTLRRAYPVKAVTTGDGTERLVEVHTLGGLTVATQLLGRELPPPTWLSFLGTGMTLREFLSHLDVWVYQGTWDLHAEIATLEALAAGLPCVLPEAAADSGLQGRVRCVAPAESVQAALDLVATPHDSGHSARRRADVWAQTLRALLDRDQLRSSDLIRLAKSARETGNGDLLDQVQADLLELTPATATDLRRTVAALAKVSHRHRAALEQWRARIADQSPGVDLTGADTLIGAARAAEMVEAGPLKDREVTELLALPEGATNLVRRLTGTRRFGDLVELLSTWSEQTIAGISVPAWSWLSHHAAGHGWTALAAEAATRTDGATLQDSTRELLAEAADEQHLLAHPWAPPARATGPEAGHLDPRSIVSVLGQSLPLRSGGYATRSHGILTSLAERGWQVNAVTRLGFPFDLWWQADDERDPALVDIVDGIPYHRLLTDGVRTYPRVPLPPYVEQGAAGIAALARDKRASLIHASSLYDVGMAGLTAARDLGVPFVYEMRGLKQLLEQARLPLFAQSPRHHYLDLLETTVAREADALLVITKALGEQMARLGVDPARITVVPNGVDVARFTPRERDEELAERLGLTDKQVIGYVGGLVHYEGLDLLFKALVELRRQRDDFHVLVVGDGAYERKLHMVVEELGVGDLITFTGRVPHEAVEGYLSLVDITPFPRKPLPVCEMISPIKPFESMAMRKAVVASDVAALAEIVQDGVTGRLFAKGDASDLARVLGELLDDPDQRARLGAAAREWVAQERDWSRITDSVDEVYRTLLGPSTAS